jgi:hypothetical protein
MFSQPPPSDLTLLLETKEEYTRQFVNITRPVFIQGVSSIYKSVREKNKQPKMILREFQTALSLVPNWSQTILQVETERFRSVTKCEWIDDLMNAIFVANVQILSHIANRDKNEKLSIEIPTLDAFLHRCYISLARNLWKNPVLLYHKVTKAEIQKNAVELDNLVAVSIVETFRQSLPYKELLGTFLGRNGYHGDKATLRKAIDTFDAMNEEEQVAILSQPPSRRESIVSEEEPLPTNETEDESEDVSSDDDSETTFETPPQPSSPSQLPLELEKETPLTLTIETNYDPDSDDDDDDIFEEKPIVVKEEQPDIEVQETFQPETPTHEVEEPFQPETPTHEVEETFQPETPTHEVQESFQSEIEVQEPFQPETPTLEVKETFQPETPTLEVKETFQPETPTHEVEETFQPETIQLNDDITSLGRPPVMVEEETTNEGGETFQKLKKIIVNTKPDKNSNKIKKYLGVSGLSISDLRNNPSKYKKILLEQALRRH